MLSSILMGAMARPTHHHRRAIDVITVTQEVIEVEYITSTIYIDEPLSTSTPTPTIVVIPTSQAPAVVIPSSTLVPTTTPVAAPAPVAVTPVSTPQPVTPPAAAITPASSTPVQVFVAPVPTTVSTPAPVVPTPTPTPTPAPAPAPTTSVAPVVVAPAAAAPSTPASSSSSSGGRFSGDGTYYATGLGSCGIVSQDTQMIAALSYLTMDLTNPGNPNNNPMCGRQVRAFSASNTEGIIISIVDTCAGCAGAHDLDFSPAAYDLLGLETVGRIPITWEFV